MSDTTPAEPFHKGEGLRRVLLFLVLSWGLLVLGRPVSLVIDGPASVGSSPWSSLGGGR
ncbi:MAG: hypothetical protein ACK40D_09435 [Cyanobacteriota bacterium]